MKLRTGRRNGRTLYLQIGEQPDGEQDPSVGMVDSAALARFLVDAGNEALAGAGPGVLEQMMSERLSQALSDVAVVKEARHGG